MNRRDFTLFVDGTAHAIGFRVGNGTTGAVVLSGTVTTGRWYTVTAWHDAAQNNLNIQLDNGTVQSVSYTGGAIDTVQPLSVGAFADGSYLLDGRVDELALYKRILTAQERTWLYNNGQGRSYADVVTNVVQYHAVLSAVTSGTCPQGETCDYDQAQTGVNNTYGYDANGNQTTRVINGVTITLSYDAEGHLVLVAGQGINAVFTYDGDGARVKSTINSVSTYFVGTYYEVSGEVATKYYYAGGSQIAMNVGNTVYYLLSDHLGSTSITTDDSGDMVSEMRYSAWGGIRFSSGNTPTDYTYTGQYSNMSDFGLMFYNARWYDPAVGRFAQADTIIPGAGQSQAWDRYAYANNAPTRYTDPTGHRVNCDKDEACKESIRLSRLKGADYWRTLIKDDYGIITSDEKHKWDETNLRLIYVGLSIIDSFFSGSIKSYVGGATFMIDGADYGQYSGWTIGTSIIFYTGSVIPAQNIYHEFGHLLNNSFNGAFAGNLGDRAHYSDDGTYWFGGNGVGLINTSLLKNPGLYDPDWTPQHDGALIDAIQHPNSSPGEQWADMFANYIAGNINLTSTGGSDMYNTVEGYLRVRGLIP